MFGPNGSGDALGTWLLLMAVGFAVCGVGGLLAYAGRWRRWYRPVDNPIRYAPLAAVPFGLGCLLELVTAPLPLAMPARQGVAVALITCLLISGLLFLRFPARLRPQWIRELDERAGREGLGGRCGGPRPPVRRKTAR
jgi:hypothetical protein